MNLSFFLAVFVVGILLSGSFKRVWHRVRLVLERNGLRGNPKTSNGAKYYTFLPMPTFALDCNLALE